MKKVEICGIDTSSLKTLSEEEKRRLLRLAQSGAVRVSFGAFNQTRDVDTLVKALSRLSAEGAR